MQIRKNGFGVLMSVVTLSVVVTGCGKGTPSPLTTEQEKTFKETMTSVQNAYQFTKMGGNNFKNAASLAVRNDFPDEQGPVVWESYTSYPSDSSVNTSGNGFAMNNTNTSEMRNRLTDAIRNGKCLQSIPSGSPNYSSPDRKLKFELKGSDCPILASFSLEAENKSFALEVNYKFQDQDFLKYNDVDQFKLKTGGSFDVSGNSMNMKFTIDGSIHSQQSGDISYGGYFNGSGSHSSQQIESVVDFTFPSFRVQLKMLNSGQDEKYYLNGKEMSREEVQRYFQTFLGK